jgi:hypothetical protein|tara:strand:- start:247 stop:459 length:213 start_codon:yes stop_codon:yes gene_type:complete
MDDKQPEPRPTLNLSHGICVNYFNEIDEEMCIQDYLAHLRILDEGETQISFEKFAINWIFGTHGPVFRSE